MILTDSSVVIVYERVPTPRLKKIITNASAYVCGVTVAELFAGVRSVKDEAKLRAALADFQILPIADALWETVGRNQASLSANGVTVPLIDTALATIAIAAGIELWTYDSHFALIQGVLPALKLFQEPP
jgi:predicted nucleic acid-binding protein